MVNSISEMRRGWISLSLGTLTLALQIGSAFAAPEQRERMETAIETAIGMEGVYYARYDGPLLEAVPVDKSAPIVLRIADVVETDGVRIYELRYIGTRVGKHDLRDYLQRADGGPIDALQPAVVTVKSILRENHDGSLDAASNPPLPAFWRYRLTLCVLAAAWLSPLVLLGVRRALRRTPRPSVPAKDPTLADQLRPFIEAAIAGRLSPQEKARLEMLLIAHWRERLDLRGLSTRDSLHRLRRHDEAGALLQQLDEWLHQRPGSMEVDVPALLDPYRDHPPVVLTEGTVE